MLALRHRDRLRRRRGRRRPPRAGPHDPEFVSLSRVADEAALEAEVVEALRQARRQKATLLIFPELSIPRNLERAIGSRIAEEGAAGYPILTLFGCCHCKDAESGLDRNEAVLLGPGGEELHRHRKLAAFTSNDGFAERIEVGQSVAVLESCLGNLVPLICLDFFNVAVGRLIDRSHGNLFLVPSLSPKTTAHSDAAKHLQVTRRASSFVCNRRLGAQPSKDDPAGTSFYRVPRRARPEVAHFPGCGATVRPHLLFRL